MSAIARSQIVNDNLTVAKLSITPAAARLEWRTSCYQTKKINHTTHNVSVESFPTDPLKRRGPAVSAERRRRRGLTSRPRRWRQKPLAEVLPLLLLLELLPLLTPEMMPPVIAPMIPAPTPKAGRVDPIVAAL